MDHSFPAKFVPLDDAFVGEGVTGMAWYALADRIAAQKGIVPWQAGSFEAYLREAEEQKPVKLSCIGNRKEWATVLVRFLLCLVNEVWLICSPLYSACESRRNRFYQDSNRIPSFCFCFVVLDDVKMQPVDSDSSLVWKSVGRLLSPLFAATQRICERSRNSLLSDETTIAGSNLCMLVCK